MQGRFEKVAIVGLGYIGLPTAATIATRGITVVGVDINARAVELINAGKAHFSEPDLDILLRSAVMTGKLRATTEVEEAEAFVIAVPTPFLADHAPDMTYVEKATRSVARALKNGDLVILESTSPVGSTEMICQWIAEERPDLVTPMADPSNPGINVAYCPERILPGRMVFELVENDRIVGGMTPACAERAKSFYEVFVRGTIHLTQARTAELCKLIENAYRDVNIAFANEISICCEKLKLDPWEAIELANRHPRVDILNPGAGVGGHCIAVDPWFLISALPTYTRLMRSAREVNDGKPHVVLETVRRQVRRFRRPIVACLGLAYKPDVDDLRESPALEIVEALVADKESDIIVVEPNIKSLPASLARHAHVQALALDDAIERCDIALVLVGHKPFMRVKRRAIEQKVVIDTCGAWRRLP
jgi:UDP-N-acetyl-D-mannosaminuronic acid dehydrogenase